MATNLEHAFDLTDDASKPNLADVWAALDTPIYRVVDEEGVNVADGKIRRLGRREWLYVDETDGYSIVRDEVASRLIAVPEADHVPCGWDRNGNVVPS